MSNGMVFRSQLKNSLAILSESLVQSFQQSELFAIWLTCHV